MFKKSLLFKRIGLILFLNVSIIVDAQIGINTEQPNTTVDVQLGDLNQINPSSPPGILAPKIKHSDLNTIANYYKNAQTGALIHIEEYDASIQNADISLDYVQSNGYHFFDGSYWQKLKNTTITEEQVEPWFSFDTHSFALTNTENIYHNAQVGIGLTGEIDPNAVLELKSTNKGLILPRLTKDQRDAISNPTVSMLIWNTSEKCFNFYKNKTEEWLSLCGDNGLAKLNIINCGSIIASGVYKEGVAPNPEENFIDLSVEVSTAGNYTIVGTSAVGIFFEKSGYFPAPGQYLIKLPAMGSPSRGGENELINLSINGYSLDCNAVISVIEESLASFSYVGFDSADPIELGASTMGKTLKLKINVLGEGTFNFITDENNGIQYKLLNKHLTVGNDQIITLYSNSAVLPITYPDETLSFRLMSDPADFMTNPDYNNLPITVNVNNNFSKLTCQSITVANPSNNYYVAGKLPFNNDNSITVTVNVTQIGPYLFTARNDAANITFKSEGNFTTTGIKTFKAYADKTLIPGDPGNYTFTSTFLGNSDTSTCSFTLDVIYPKESAYMAVYGVGITNKFRDALTDIRNFGPTGTFKIEPLISTYNNWGTNSTIYQSGNNTILPSDLTTFINVYKARMILITWDANKELSDESAAILADFINNKKGSVFVVNGQRIGPLVKKIIDTVYDTDVTMTTDFAQIRAVTLPNLSDNPYINGPFGNVANQYFVSDDYESWLGVDSSSLGSTLNAFTDIPETVNGNTIYPERKTLLYSTTPGFFLIPDAGALDNTGNNYGQNKPIGLNSGNGSNNIPILGSDNSISNDQILTGKAANWVFFGNIMSKLIQHAYQTRNQ